MMKRGPTTGCRIGKNRYNAGCIIFFRFSLLTSCLLQLTRNQGVVNFVSDRVQYNNALIRPKASTPTRMPLSPHFEDDEKSSDAEFSLTSVGAHGIPLGFGTPTTLSEDNSDDDDERDDCESEIDDDEGDDDGTSSSASESCEDLEESLFESCDSSEVDVEGLDRELNDDELSDILQSLEDDRLVPEPELDRLTSEPNELDTSERLIGVMEDREDLSYVVKAKRVLSSSTLSILNTDDSAKRRKVPNEMPHYSDHHSVFTFLSLGPPAMSDFPMTRLQMRRESPAISSSEDEEEELDRQLEEELKSQEQSVGNDSRKKTPVPLLTPPGSPLTIVLDGHTTTVCEWPSNMAVDSAMTAVSQLRPMSPASLENLERFDQQLEESQRRPSSQAPSSTLSPLLRGIYVGVDRRRQ
jgi:hypothetical protein